MSAQVRAAVAEVSCVWYCLLAVQLTESPRAAQANGVPAASTIETERPRIDEGKRMVRD